MDGALLVCEAAPVPLVVCAGAMPAAFTEAAWTTICFGCGLMNAVKIPNNAMIAPQNVTLRRTNGSSGASGSFSAGAAALGDGLPPFEVIRLLRLQPITATAPPITSRARQKYQRLLA